MRFKLFVGALVLLTLGYGILWYAVASRMRSDLPDQLMAANSSESVMIKIGDLSISGFPYRHHVEITGLEVVSANGTSLLAARRVGATTHLWTPGHWVLDATDVSFSTPLTGGFDSPTLVASIRRQASGHRGIFVGAGPEGQARHQSGLVLEDWSLSIGLPARDASADGGLYGDTAMLYRLAARLGGVEVKAEGAVEGRPAPLDWSVGELSRWRDAGGIIKVESFSASLAEGAATTLATAGGSLALDERLRLVGTATLTGAAEGDLSALLAHIGVPGSGAERSDLLFLNGDILLDGERVAGLQPVVR